MKNSALSLLFVGFGLTMGSCNKEKFASGGMSPATPEKHLVTINGIDNYDAGYKTIASIDNLDFSIQETAFRTEINQTDELFPVDLYYVVDVTASMTDELEAVRRSLPEITNNLRQRNVDLWSGFIGFIDGVSSQHTKELSSDLEGLSAFIGNIQATGNADNEEGAIAAAAHAADRFLQGAGRPNAAKIILLITDVVGHDGSGSNYNRNCRISPFVSKYNQLATQLADSKKIKFFYSVPNPRNFKGPGQSNRTQDDIMAHHTCRDTETGVTYNAKSQMEALMNALTPQYAHHEKGGPLLMNDDLAWPLSGDVLTTTLVPMIETTIPSSRTLSCMAQNIDVLSNNQSLKKWTKQDQNLLPTTKNAIILSEIFSGSRVAGQELLLTINIDRCCMEVGPTNEPVNNQCVTRYTQNVNYKIINR